MGGPDLDND